MRQHKFSRTELLIGKAALAKLSNSTVVIFGIGGVGSYAAEALARSGIGNLVLVDYDDICLTNINRQIHALHSTVGQAKVEVMKRRILDINPSAQVVAVKEFFSAENAERLLSGKIDYVVDAIDTVSSKVCLAKECLRRGIPLISSMGAGNRLSAANFRVADIAETRGDRLARAVRRLLRREGITRGIKVVYSTDPVLVPLTSEADCRNNCICPEGDAHCALKRQVPGSIAFVPPVAGLLMAGEVVKDLIAECPRN